MKILKRFAVSAATTAMVAATVVAPASATGFASNMGWTHGAQGIQHFVNSQDCEFIRGHAPMMGYTPGTTVEQAERDINANPVIRTYMSRRIDEGAGQHAKMIPNDVREKLIDLGIAGSVKKVSDCGLVTGEYNGRYDQLLAEGNAAYGTIDPVGVVNEIPLIVQAYSS